MRITYDSEVDALYIRFIETTVTTKHVADGIAVDYDAEDRIEDIEDDDELFEEKMKRLTAKLEEQFAESASLEAVIKRNLRELGFGSDSR